MSHEFDWSEYLFFAKETIGIPGISCAEEAKFRAAISRAYYAAYWKARKFVEKDASYVSPKGYYKHEEIRDYFLKRRKKDTIYNSIYLNLLRLHDLRIIADYKDTQEIILRDTYTALSYAQHIVNQVSYLK